MYICILYLRVLSRLLDKIVGYIDGPGPSARQEVILDHP